MAVAAYAAVVSLMHVLDQLQHYPPPRLLYLDRDQIETLREKVSFLQDFLELHSQRFYAGLEGLVRQIANAAAEAEDIIDAHVVDQLISQTPADASDIDISSSWKLGIDNVIEKIESIKKELMIIKEGMTINEQGPKVSDASRSPPPSSSNNAMVGFDDRLDQIIDELTGNESDLQVLAIVGMGGIGKTMLAKNAFDNSYIMRHFDLRTWSTISQEYSMRGALLGFLKELGYPQDKDSGEGVSKLGERLYRELYDRRYLVVMDDVWTIEVWENLRSFFPDNNNGSRIVMTTRLSPVAVALGSQKPYVMNFLGEGKSWDLFSMKAFGKDGHCPPELEKAGKSIAKSCRGLPLAIVVIGGMLSKSNMTRDVWECVAKDVNSFANLGDNEHCLNILSLSYNQLPIHLKPCFLYMREFPEDVEIYASGIITLWVVGGILKPIEGKTLEEVAKEYLEDLKDRNLILAGRLGINENLKTCRIHDLLRDLCIREFQKEHFLFAPKTQCSSNYEYYPVTKCFVCSSEEACTGIDLPRVISSQKTSPASCSVCDGCRTKYPQLNKLRLVKVLHEDILHPTRLGVLSLSGNFKFVDGLMHLLWNLQSLDIATFGLIVLPCEIWELPQLRHLNTEECCAVLPEPPLITEVNRKDSTVLLKNLETLSIIENFEWSDDAIERLFNLKKLGIHYYDCDEGFIEWSYYSLHNLDRLYKLESLHFDTELPYTLKNNITFPHSLKILSLFGCQIPWEEMTIIGSLPNLETLKLRHYAFTGPDWYPIEGEFLQLKKLSIQQNDLKHWEAEKVHFPNLQYLKLSFIEYLEEIPSSIGETVNLCSIQLFHCTNSVINWRKQY